MIVTTQLRGESVFLCHCEERNDEAISALAAPEIASLRSQ